ncbi:MAG TPA: hypothetical protein VKA36_01645 [Solirubrobacterales bacterium]|nr:hypothetical protein [Solirubrobacterales bacterium]
MYPSTDTRSAERGFASVSTLLGFGAVAVLVFALLGAAGTQPDRFGRIPVPSTAFVSLPGAESSMAWTSPDGSPPPADLRITVIDPRNGTSLRVNSRGGEATTRNGRELKPVARVDPPRKGVFKVRVTSKAAALQPGTELAFGETAAGAIGGRLGQVGTLLTGPAGIVAGLLLLGALLAPSVTRATRRSAGAT